MSVLANLQAAKSAIALQQNWGRSQLKDAEGRMCALGAVREVVDMPDANLADLDKLPEVRLLAKFGCPERARQNYTFRCQNSASVFMLNDRGCHADVMSMFDAAIEEARIKSL